jgi:hypothetical protein
LVGLLGYINLLLLGFYGGALRSAQLGASPGAGGRDFDFLFGINVFLFYLLGFALLRNREQARRRVRELGEGKTLWVEAFWPATYVFLAGILCTFAILARITWLPHRTAEWDWKWSLFLALFVLVGILRDILYLQWMNLRRSRHSLALAVLYEFVFYVSVTVFFIPLELFGAERTLPIAALAIPWMAFLPDAKAFATTQDVWLLSLLGQVFLTGVFAMLHRGKLEEMAPKRAALPVAAD